MVNELQKRRYSTEEVARWTVCNELKIKYPNAKVSQAASNWGQCHIQTFIQMNTEQNYVGRDSHANTVEQTVQTTPSVDNPSLASTFENVGPNKEIYDARIKVLNLVEGFLGTRLGITPIEAINCLLQSWLTTNPTNVVASPSYEKKLATVLDTVSFLSQLQQEIEDLHYLVEEVEKGGTSHE